MKIGIVLPLLCLSLLSGCNVSLEDRIDRALAGGFIAGDIIAYRGQPKYIIDTTSLGGPQTISMVYRGVSKNCIESYLVEVRSQRVLEHSCR